MSLCNFNRLGGVVIGVLELTVVDCGFEFRSRQAKYFKIGICCYFVYHLALRKKTHDCLASRIRYLLDVEFCVSEPALWKLIRYVGLVQTSSSFHQKANWDDPVVRRKFMWQSEEKDMKENYKFLVSLRKQIGFGSEKQYLQTGNPSNIPNPIHTLEKKIWMFPYSSLF